jgi:hypothetical protein
MLRRYLAKLLGFKSSITMVDSNETQEQEPTNASIANEAAGVTLPGTSACPKTEVSGDFLVSLVALMLGSFDFVSIPGLQLTIRQEKQEKEKEKDTGEAAESEDPSTCPKCGITAGHKSDCSRRYRSC